jgi:hypothetical protein
VLEGEINKLTETEIDLYIWKGENNETALCVQDQTYGRERALYVIDVIKGFMSCVCTGITAILNFRKQIKYIDNS